MAVDVGIGRAIKKWMRQQQTYAMQKYENPNMLPMENSIEVSWNVN